MPCKSFEDLLIDYAEIPASGRECVDAHLAGCAACGEYLETLLSLDAGLGQLFAGAQVSPAFRTRVLSQVCVAGQLAKPSFLPEILDFIGWIGVIAAAVCLAALLMPLQAIPRLPADFNTFATAIAAALAILAALWVGVFAYHERRE